MTDDVRLQPFPIKDLAKVKETRDKLAQKLAWKPTLEFNFINSHVGITCCFNGKTAYLTDENLQPLVFYESNSFFHACCISATAKYAVFQMAYNKENDLDSGAMSLFAVREKKLIARRRIPSGWKGIRHLFIDEVKERIFVYYDNRRVEYDFNLEPISKL